MRENGLYPVTLRKWKPYRKGKCDAMYSENLVQRKFDPDSLNAVWAGDITYVKTTLGWVYLAVVLDLCNKEAVGYAVSKNIDTELVKRALSNAIMQRGHHDGLIFHSDRGVQYSSMGYRTMLSENGITPSMSAPGCPYDNMPAWKASSLASRRSWPTGVTSRTSKMCGRPLSGISSYSTTGNGSIVRWDT